MAMSTITSPEQLRNLPNIHSKCGRLSPRSAEHTHIYKDKKCAYLGDDSSNWGIKPHQTGRRLLQRPKKSGLLFSLSQAGCNFCECIPEAYLLLPVRGQVFEALWLVSASHRVALEPDNGHRKGTARWALMKETYKSLKDEARDNTQG